MARCPGNVRGDGWIALGMQRSVNAPTVSQASQQGGRLQADAPSPFRDGEGLSMMRDQMIAPRIVRLFSCGGPAHIPRLIVSVVVDAIYAACSRRSRTDVRDKRFKGSIPLRADANPAPAIVVELATLGIRAAVPHALPRSILSRAQVTVPPIPAESSGMAMSPSSCADAISLKTSARCRPTVEEISGTHDALGFAVASAQEAPRSSGGWPCAREDHQSTKTFADCNRQRDRSWHWRIYSNPFLAAGDVE